MPIFDIKQQESKEVAKATFDSEKDYKVVTLNNDPTSKPRLLHVIQADKLIKSNQAVEVKDSELEKREVETVTTVEKKKK